MTILNLAAIATVLLISAQVRVTERLTGLSVSFPLIVLVAVVVVAVTATAIVLLVREFRRGGLRVAYYAVAGA